jgi:hypothetical protein
MYSMPMSRWRRCISILNKYRGFNIGQRIIDEYLAKSEVKQCRSNQDVAESIGKVN